MDEFQSSPRTTPDPAAANPDLELAALRAELQRTKRELEKNQQELKRLQQRTPATADETTQHFLSSVSHDLRTPLSAILLWTSLIEDEKMTEPAQLSQALRAIKDSAEELSVLVEQVGAQAHTLAAKLKADAVASAAPGAASSAPAASAAAAPLGRCHVLLVEDDPGIRAELTAMLEKVGATVDAVDSAAAAWEALDQHRPDVIVSDMTLPTIDAADFIRELRESEASGALARVPALALTRDNDAATINEALRNGFQSSLAKPVQVVQLIASIATLLHGQRAVPQAPRKSGKE